jgi:cytochrome c oxidase subunit 2
VDTRRDHLNLQDLCAARARPHKDKRCFGGAAQGIREPMREGPMSRRVRARAHCTGAGVALVATLAIAGCGSEQSTLDPQSRPARDIADLWWWMLAAAVFVFAGALALLVLAWVRRRQPGLPLVGRLGESGFNGLVVVFGMVVPLLALIVVFVVANFSVASVTDAPDPGSTAMTIVVTGNQWFWDVRYPGDGAVTANEIHIPTRTRVNTVLRTDDVIHSFWMPQLNRKADMIPGHPNRILLYADHPGVYRGQCAEFCGLQHANMAMTVVAQTPPRFRAWLANMARPRRAPASAEARRGEQVFLSERCSSCHTIRGTTADGSIGPDLTHVATRARIAAQTIANTEHGLTRWVSDPQRIKPGTKMPAVDLSTPELRAVVSYLRGLR